ncbi:type II toxin-antitoxin system VapC family toxin [Lipingzhangella sp. LS1_29]|uniref:Type II toxin-antitoxin system VapC family toxin n=1 Tax=Lipingzhangella rawalii TaxID=2055835 RepID=A0ABU2H8T6_9ACTN|nr:type II toxin-antitoxin system VapC family toxin [Lipingzhangella rawalii]MDS1271709.1 type II toxin-antitoxin system VapC family toxin [Lipingzhangella rawalii]
MRLLLDTCVLLWWFEDHPALAPQACAAIAERANDVYVSSVSAVEIAVKSSLGKLKIPADPQEQVAADGFTLLPLTFQHGMQLQTLPWHHRDPFDRMLIAQAQVENLTIVTADRIFADYEVPTLSARA